MPTKKANTTKKRKKNNYQQKAKKKSFMQGFSDPSSAKGNIQSTLALTGLTVLVAVGGGFAGAAIGKPALLIGAGVTGAGHYTGSPLTTMLGLSMMASGGFLSGNKSVNGIKGLDGAKERMKLFQEELKQKFYLDKIKKKKTDETKKTAVGEIGAAQYFNYPELAAYYNNNANLDLIEAQISGAAGFAGDYTGEISGYPADVSEMIL